MEFLVSLWLPVLVSSAFVFMASSFLHMVVNHHAADYSGVNNETEMLASMRSQGLQPGHYAFPYASDMKECATPEMLEKYKQGPCGFMSILENGPPNMGKHLRNWFIYTVVISILIAYVASFTLKQGNAFMEVFRLTGTVGILCYGAGEAQASIWKGQPWPTTFRFFCDSVVYGCVSGLAFAWLWPL